MCSSCDPAGIIASAGLKPSPHRVAVLAAILASDRALTPTALLDILRKGEPMNKVTLYRTLDLFVDRGIVARHGGVGRSSHYCAAGLPLHPRHHHLWCSSCGELWCLNPESVTVSLSGESRLEPTDIQGVEVRLDGVCSICRAAGPGGRSRPV